MNITMRTFWQGLVLAAIIGPITWLCGMGDGLSWNCFAMFLAPFVVDVLRPVVRR